MSSVDPSLLAIFEAEQREHVERIRALVGPAGGASALPAGAVEELLRRAHTLKGAARAVGLNHTELLVHRIEGVFARLRGGSLALDARVHAAIRAALDASEDATAAVLAGLGEPEPAGALRAVEAVLGMAPASPPPEPAPEVSPLPAGGSADLARVSGAWVDRLVASASQLLAAVSSGGTGRGLDALVERCESLAREGRRLRREDGHAQAAEPLTRLEAELHALAREARRLRTAHQRDSWTLERLAAEVYDDSCRVRMTPAETVFGVFRRMVREMASAAGKQVEFRSEGLEAQADRLVLQALKDPVMHLLRNAISHGIETPGERAAAGKPATGTVELRVEARGDRLVVTVSDDGRGIDPARIRQAAVRRGLISPDDESTGEPSRLAAILLSPGFSTSDAVTTLAGRGMGLSAVDQQVARLQGRVDFHPSGKGGLAVALSVPLSISMHHVVLVAAGDHRYALPSAAIDRLLRVPIQEVESVDAGEAVRLGPAAVPLANLADLLETGGTTAAPEESAHLSIAILKSGDFRAGLIVDRLLDEREVVVKDLGLPPEAAGLSTGGVPLEDGGVAVVLNPAVLLERFRLAGQRPIPRRALPEQPKPAATILVVDDSITTRSLEKSILEAHGYRVRLAVDGREALEQLRAGPADLVISDVAMPRMDGFELLVRMKKDPQLARIPVILVTSLEDLQDQERGLALGADAYIVKRKFDQQELLATVRQIL